jgi:hypothetical protein
MGKVVRLIVRFWVYLTKASPKNYACLLCPARPNLSIETVIVNIVSGPKGFKHTIDLLHLNGFRLER